MNVFSGFQWYRNTKFLIAFDENEEYFVPFAGEEHCHGDQIGINH